MSGTDFLSWALPSFRQQADYRLGQLSRLLTAILATEPWDSPHARACLDDARLLRHGLTSLLDPTITEDEQRFIVERLLPLVPRPAGGLVAEPPVPVFVPVSLTLFASDGLEQTARVETGPLTPNGATLIVLRDAQTLFSTVIDGPIQYPFTDEAPGFRYTAQLWFRGQLIGYDVQQRELPEQLYYGVFSTGTLPTEGQLLGMDSRPAINQTLTFTVPAGRHRLYLVIPTGRSYLLVDPTRNDDLSHTFQPQSTASGTVLRQRIPVIGPFQVRLEVQLT